MKLGGFYFESRVHTVAKANREYWLAPIFYCPLREEGVQGSSNSNHSHPNLFCGKRAPQLVISTTSISNHRKILFFCDLNLMYF